MNFIHHAKSPLDSRQINAFASLAKTGSFKETARELFLTNSAVSHSMRALEAEVGCRLLSRVGKRVRLTEEGEAFLHYASLGLEAFAKARQTMDEFKEWGSRRLRLGAGACMSRILLPPVLDELRREYPRLMVSASIVHPWEISAGLEKGDLDFVLGAPPYKLPQIEFIHMFDSPLRIVVSADHRWAKRGGPPWAELAGEPCFLTNRSHPTHRLVENYFATEQIKVNRVAEIDSFDAIKEVVRRGLGMTILPDWAIKEELAAGVLAAFGPGRRRLIQSWGLLRWRGRPLSPVENHFRLSCVAVAKTLCS